MAPAVPRLDVSTEIAAPIERVWAFYDTVQTLPRITPPTTRVRLVDPPTEMKQGSRFTLVISQPPVYVPLKWETVITEHRPPTLFVDEQGKGPFAYWRHEHHFQALGPDRTLLRDVLTYQAPLGFLGVLADWLFLRRQMEAMFAYRHQATREALEGATKR